MSLEQKFPAYGGHGPADFRLGIALGLIATTFMILRVYVRLRVNKFGTTALLLSLLAWVGRCTKCNPKCILTLNSYLQCLHKSSAFSPFSTAWETISPSL